MSPPLIDNKSGNLEACDGAIPTDSEKAEARPPPTAFTSDGIPDGGLQAWLTVFGAWCISFCSFGWINSVGTFQDYYERDLLRQYSASEIAWIPSLQIFFMFAMGPIVGKIYDSNGPRNIILVGSFLHVFGLMMASISSTYYQVLLSQGVCSAIGVACIFQPALSCVGGWFSKKRGAAYGVLSTGSSIGGVIFPIMINRLITEISYGWAMRISAFLILGLLIIANIVTKARLPPSPHRPTREELMRPFKEPTMLLATAGVTLLTFAIFVPITYIVVEAIADGMSPDLAQYLIPMLNAGSVFGRAISGILSVKVGIYNIFIAVCYATGIILLAFWIPATSNAAIIVFAVCFGFVSGAYVTLIPGLVVQISPPAEIGFRTGLMFLSASVGGLTTGPITGAILARDLGNFLGMKIFAGVFSLVGTTVVLLARLHATKWKLIVKF